MLTDKNLILCKQMENTNCTNKLSELEKIQEMPNDVENHDKLTIEQPDISFIENTSRSALNEKLSIDAIKLNLNEFISDLKGLTDYDKMKIKEISGWSDEIINNIHNMKQYEILKNAGLEEVEINGRKCLIKKNIDLNFVDEDGLTNKDRISRGLAPIDSKTGNPIELHHLGQNIDSPLVELTKDEHRTGEYEYGKKNQSLWHDNTIETKVHGEGSFWDKERKDHWKTRAEFIERRIK